MHGNILVGVWACVECGWCPCLAWQAALLSTAALQLLPCHFPCR
jgi:hypothetical protein